MCVSFNKGFTFQGLYVSNVHMAEMYTGGCALLLLPTILKYNQKVSDKLSIIQSEHYVGRFQMISHFF